MAKIIGDRFEARVLLTGASGFVGGRLRDALLEAGADVVAIRRASSPAPERGRSVVADYADLAGLERVMAEEKPDYVLHVAGATKGVTYQDFEHANVMPTRNLLAAAKAACPELKRYLLVSSLAAYGPSTVGKPLTEDAPRRPIEHYGRSKAEAEEVLEAEAELRWTIIRPAGVYGPGDVDYFNVFREVEKGRDVYFGNEHRWFSAVYVDDCVRAIVDAAQSERTAGEGYFICDGEPLTWGMFQQAVVRAAARKVRTLRLPGFLVDVAAAGGELMTKLDGKPRLFNRQKAIMGAQEAWTCRHDKAREHFGYRPRIPVDDGVRLALVWYRQHGWL